MATKISIKVVVLARGFDPASQLKGSVANPMLIKFVKLFNGRKPSYFYLRGSGWLP
jgi:hypothetical protein